jgi:hypothetical protein
VSEELKDLPKITGLRGKLGVLERRREHLSRRISDPGRREASRDFDRAEESALGAAIAAMEYIEQVRGKVTINKVEVASPDPDRFIQGIAT